MISNVNRIGRFTSSKIHVLLGTGSRPMTEEELKNHKLENPKSQKKNIDDGFSAGALTYIKQRRAERSLGRSIDTNFYNQAMSWGKFCEAYLYWKEGLLGFEYSLTSQESMLHPEYPFWAGSPDLKKKDCGSEIKCYYPENFYNYSSVLILEDLEKLKKDFKEEYWQIVSNACIMGFDKGEAIAFMPTESQLIEMRRLIEYTDFIEKKMNDDQWKYRFIYEKPIEELPYIPDGIEYPNLVKFEFEIPKEDKELLTKRVIEAEEYLISGKLI